MKRNTSLGSIVRVATPLACFLVVLSAPQSGLDNNCTMGTKFRVVSNG
jgi:hypothetical protein